MHNPLKTKIKLTLNKDFPADFIAEARSKRVGFIPHAIGT
jgi:hypothetical protein